MITFVLVSPVGAQAPGPQTFTITATSDNPSPGLEDSFILKVNGVTVDATVTESLGTYTIEYEESLLGPQNLVIRIEGTDLDDTYVSVYASSVDSEAFFSEEQYFVANYLDTLLSYFPDYTKARGEQYSVARQLLNPIALKLDEYEAMVSGSLRRLVFSQSLADDADWLFSYDLQEGEEFATQVTTSGEHFYIQPSVWGLSGVSRVELSPKEGWHDFWTDALPDRFLGALVGKAKPISGSHNINRLEDFAGGVADLNLNVFVELHSSSGLHDRVNGVFGLRVVLDGLSAEGTRQKETLYMFRNGYVQSRLRWKYISSMKLLSQPADAEGEICLHQMPLRMSAQVDPLFTVPSSTTKEIIEWVPGTSTAGSYIDRRKSERGYLADAITDIDSFETLDRYWFRDTTDVKVDIEDFALSPSNSWIYGISGTTLYIWDRRDTHHTALVYLNDSTEVPEVDFYIVKRQPAEASGNDILSTITIECDKAKGNEVVNRWYWSVVDSAGTRTYIKANGDIDGEAPYWFTNSRPFVRFGLSTVEFDLNFTDVGDYVIELNMEMVGGDLQVTRKALQIHTKKALAEYEIGHLFTQTEPISSLFIDANNRLLVINASMAYSLTPMFDSFLLDVEGSRILMREEFDAVEVRFNE